MLENEEKLDDSSATQHEDFPKKSANCTKKINFQQKSICLDEWFDGNAWEGWWGGGGVGEGHCTLNLSINAIFPILILRTAEVPENYTKPPRGPKKRTSAPVLTQKHSDDV